MRGGCTWFYALGGHFWDLLLFHTQNNSTPLSVKKGNLKSDLKTETGNSLEKKIDEFTGFLLVHLKHPWNDHENSLECKRAREFRIPKREPGWYLRMRWANADILRLCKNAESLVLPLEVLIQRLWAGASPLCLTSSPGWPALQPG